nr:S1 family peptidase [Auraticoccus cholistanensis]
MEQALARSEGTTVAQARQQIATENALSAKAARLDASLADSEHAGSWIAGDELVVAVTTDEAAAEVRAAGARPETVRRSQADLDAVQARLDRLARTGGAGGVLSWGADPRSNAVTVEVAAGADDAATEAFVAEAEELGAEVVRSGAEIRPLASVLGGQEYVIDNAYVCSTGFGARDSAGRPVVVTAGHCTEGASRFTFRGTTLGTHRSTRFPGDDWGTIAAASTHTLVAAVDTYDGSSVRVAGSTAAAVGANLCKSGRTTDWTCGRVTGLNRTVNYGGGDIVSGLTEHTACVEQGDSGGANVSGTQAQGVSSGGALYSSGGSLVCGEKVGQRNAAYFQPLNEVLQREGLRLLTS